MTIEETVQQPPEAVEESATEATEGDAQGDEIKQPEPVETPSEEAAPEIKPATRTWSGAVSMDEIARRQATRKRIQKEAQSISPPIFTDDEAVKEYSKKLKEKREEFQDACYLIDYDLDLYRRGFEIAVDALCGAVAGTEPGKMRNVIFAQAYDEVPLSAHDREKADFEREREKKAAEDEEKAKRKAAGVPEELEGQMRIPLKTKVRGDDGSCAEAAGECVTRPLEEVEVNEPAEPVNEPAEPVNEPAEPVNDEVETVNGEHEPPDAQAPVGKTRRNWNRKK
jgi:hypothetical protein